MRHRLSILLVIAAILPLYVTKEEEDATTLVDVMIEGLKEDKNFELDPFEMDDTTVRVFGVINVLFYDGIIRGMSDLSRDGGATMRNANDLMQIKTTFAIRNIVARLKPRVGPVDIGRLWTLVGNITSGLVDIQLDVDSSGATRPQLKSIKLRELKGLKLALEGGRVSSRILSPVVNTFGRIFRSAVKDIFQDVVEGVLKKILRIMTLPF